ncbi:MAG: ribonuclease III [Flavobacteriales bacterium]|jgi:ribonuclease-3
MRWKLPFFSRSKKSNHQIKAFVKDAFGVHTKDTTMYEQALRHSSAAQKIKPGLKNSNERLEFLGDAILDSIIAHYLYNKYPTIAEGELTKMKSKVVRRENLNMIGFTLHVDEMLVLNLGRQEMHDSLVGNALEALIGALYLDKGYNTTRDVVLKLLKQHGLDTKVHDDVDYKSKLHEWGQKYKRALEFKVVSHRNEGGASHYEIILLIDEKEYGHGEGGSKKIAEQKAAKQAVDSLFKS